MKQTVSSRRKFLLGGGAALAAVATAGCAASQAQPSPTADQVKQLQKDKAELRATIDRLAANSASGGGVNLKMMPDPKTGEATVSMEEVFSFSRYHAMCRVDTNPQAFKMKTFKMGEVTIEPNQFYMSMVATSIDQYQVETQPDKKRKVTMRGGLDCTTVVGQATTTFGSRTAAEPSTYRIEAISAGIGGAKAGNSFAFTTFFDPDKAPLNHDIFGPEFTFTGKLVAGEITIIDSHA